MSRPEQVWVAFDPNSHIIFKIGTQNEVQSQTVQYEKTFGKKLCFRALKEGMKIYE